MNMKKELIDLYKSSKYGKLIGGLIHNLNTPIMGISGRLELLQMKNPDLKGLDKIESQLSRINRILKNVTYVIDVDKNMDDHLVSVREVIEQFDIFYMSNMTYKHRREVILNVDNNVVADINASVLLNILTLAIDYILDNTADGEQVTIFLNTEDENASIDICFKLKEDAVIIETDFFNSAKLEDELELKLIADLISQSEFTIALKAVDGISHFNIEFPARKCSNPVEENNDFLLDDDDGEIDIEALLKNASK